MKKIMFSVVFAVMACIAAMGYIHWQSVHEIGRNSEQVQMLFRRQSALNSLSLSLEQYRRQSSSFRKMSPAEMGDVKEHLKGVFKENTSRLNQLDPTEPEKTASAKLNDQLLELLSKSAEYEATLYSKDAYAKPEIREIHDQLASVVSGLKKSTEARIQALASTSSAPSPAQARSMQLFLAVGGLILALVTFLLGREYWVYSRPLGRLFGYARDLKKSGFTPKAGPGLTGMLGEIESTLHQAALRLETHAKERHKFIQGVVADLRAPLQMLQAGKRLVGANGTTESQQIQAAESMRRGLAILSGSLDDLDDVIDINRLDNRLDEKLVDLSELVRDVARTLGGPGETRQISTTVPPMPVWMQLDAVRMERVLIQSISKVMSTLPPTGGLQIQVSESNGGRMPGIEITLQEARDKAGDWSASGPEVDLLSHWISENGLAMALVQKIVRAHGGSMSAAGVAGASVRLTIRLPQERVVSRGLIAPPTGLNVSASVTQEPQKIKITTL